jgi:hypothetical protein
MAIERVLYDQQYSLRFRPQAGISFVLRPPVRVFFKLRGSAKRCGFISFTSVLASAGSGHALAGEARIAPVQKAMKRRTWPTRPRGVAAD